MFSVRSEWLYLCSLADGELMCRSLPSFFCTMRCPVVDSRWRADTMVKACSPKTRQSLRAMTASTPSTTELGGDDHMSSLTHPRRMGRPCTASQVWGICSVLKFNPLLPDCKGRITTCVRKGVKDGRPAYRCSYCRKQISQLNGPTPWAQKSAASPASFFCQMDCRGRPNVRLSKCEILWIVYCMAKDLTVAKTTELGYAVRTPTISYWRQRVRQAISRSLSGHPRMGGNSERVQGQFCTLKGSPRDREQFRFHVSTMPATSTGQNLSDLPKMAQDCSVALRRLEDVWCPASTTRHCRPAL
ncbi:uncharacterized protein LOC142560164 isoform X5 [Dermacentor variabilis]|uniref:uncharacterized protein LOC142560164 isoform X5 n=1 Tax=Dermacentor variabilis TaxID=34621 RepID=UPI003F5C1808